jgi:exodeoxyribonuclease VII large subunit
VTSLTAELDQLLQKHYPTLVVEGEIAQLQLPASGHAYLVLRDRHDGVDCVLGAVVWRGDWQRFRYRPKVGERVLCRGRLGLFAPRGTTQLYVTDIAPAGAGDMAAQILARKARLLADGLLDPRRKRVLPRFPRVVGVATSPTGAALQDFLAVSRGRYPAARILVAGCVVTGPEAPPSVIRAVELLLEDGRSEVIVVTRGGGSKEDLHAFNDEQLARYLAASPVPIVSAVGHQIDETIADLVADAVAPTPSAAAILVLPDGRELTQRVDEAATALDQAMGRRLLRQREQVRSLAARLRHPSDRIRELRRWHADLVARLSRIPLRRLLEDRKAVVRIEERLLRTWAPILVARTERSVAVGAQLEPALRATFADRRRRVETWEARLRALSPLAVLARGYAIVTGPHGLVRDPGDVVAGDPLVVRVQGGRIAARVT